MNLALDLPTCSFLLPLFFKTCVNEFQNPRGTMAPWKDDFTVSLFIFVLLYLFRKLQKFTHVYRKYFLFHICHNFVYYDFQPDVK